MSVKKRKRNGGERLILWGGAYVRNTIFFGRQMGLKPGGGWGFNVGLNSRRKVYIDYYMLRA